MARFTLSSISDAQLSASGNNFTGVRLVLASAVIWTHCYWLVNGTAGTDEIAVVIGMPISALAVNAFFFVSGFLICQSLFRQPGVLSFAAMRIARIWPAMIVSSLLTLLVFGLLSGRFAGYAADLQSVKFLVRNLTLLRAEYALPALSGGGEPMVVNGSLWTIPWELRCYALMALGFGFTAAKRPAAVRPVLVASIIAAMLWALAQEFWSGFPSTAAGLLFNIDVAMRLWGCFAAGALVWLERHRAMPPLWMAVGALLGAVAEYQLAGTALLASPAFFLLVMLLAFGGGPARATTARWPDFSYGIYIYAYPVMMVIATLWPGLTDDHRLLALANFALVLPIAVVSWYAVERPALAWARSWLRRRRARQFPQLSVAE